MFPSQEPSLLVNSASRKPAEESQTVVGRDSEYKEADSFRSVYIFQARVRSDEACPPLYAYIFRKSLSSRFRVSEKYLPTVCLLTFLLLCLLLPTLGYLMSK